MVVENGKVVIHAVHERDAEKFWKKLELKEVEMCAVEKMLPTRMLVHSENLLEKSGLFVRIFTAFMFLIV